MNTDHITQRYTKIRTENPHISSALIDAWEERDRLQHKHDQLRVTLATLIGTHHRNGSVPLTDLQAALTQAQDTEKG